MHALTSCLLLILAIVPQYTGSPSLHASLLNVENVQSHWKRRVWKKIACFATGLSCTVCSTDVYIYGSEKVHNIVMLDSKFK